MRKLLNTIYVTNDQAYLSLDGENLVCKVDGQKDFRVPFDNVEAVVCFSYLGCSPALMGKCVEKLIPITFLTPQGHFQAKVCGETKGNVFLRVAQIERFKEDGLQLAKNSMAAKFANSISVLKRSVHDSPEIREDAEIQSAIAAMTNGTEAILNADSIETVLGIEGNCAREYFRVYGKLFTKGNARFEYRNRRPPLDPVNAVLSFVYTLYTNEYAAALETVGLDSYIGFYHALRSGRSSLACDLVEEARCFVDRFAVTMFNLGILSDKDFEKQESGAVYLNADGRKKVLTKWQEKKRTELTHPFLKQKIQFGLLPYVQSNLLAKYIRKEIPEYPCFLNR